MQVNSVSAAQPSFKSYQSDLEAFANLSDRDVRKLAYAKASQSVNDKKHKRIGAAIMYSIPVVAGIAAAVKSPSTLLLPLKGAANVNFSRAGRLVNFASTTLNWLGTFAIIDTIFGIKRHIDKKSPAMRDFAKENPVISTLATLGLSVASVYGASKGFSKLLNKFVPKDLTKAQIKNLVKYNKKLTDNKVLNSLSKNLDKVPSALKQIGKTALDWAPMAMIFGSLAHSMGHQRVKAEEYSKNYNDIKTAQALVREGLAQESVDEF
ncbi:hypothetical protein HDR58_02790 [bacterium]|nr:hypothetical protein [bacterium]